MDTARRWQVHRPGHQRDSRPGFMGGTGNGKTHFPAGQIGDAAHRINRLVSRSGGHQHLLAQQQFGLEKGNDFFQQLVRLQHAAVARFATGLITAADVKHSGPVRLQLHHVALGSGMGPHLTVHGRRQQQRHLIKRARQAHQAEQIIGLTM